MCVTKLEPGNEETSYLRCYHVPRHCLPLLPIENQKSVMSRVCVFCGSRSGDDPEFINAARQLGEYLVSNGHTLIYGGGGVGVMGAIADTMLERDGKVIGVIPAHLARAEVMHPRVADMRITTDMHVRKALMHELTDIYVALPGGFGTMEELFEAVTWAQLELHARPIAVLNIAGLYAGLVALLDAMQARGFLSAQCRSLLTVFETTAALVKWISAQSESMPQGTGPGIIVATGTS